MCYYNSVNIKMIDAVTLAGSSCPLPDSTLIHQPLQSGFDHKLSPVIKKEEGSSRFSVTAMEWGFLPPYIKNRAAADRFRKGYKDETGLFHPPVITLNAVGEELLLPRKIYREAALDRRCLILSSGFFEWRHQAGVNKKTGAPLKTILKYPYYIHLKNRDYFFMAGIWQSWLDSQTGEYTETFAIITTAANPLMEKIHNSKKRMPCILDEEKAAEWLLGRPDESRITALACSQYPQEQMEAYTIAKNFRESDDPTMPYQYAELSEL
jgi:hypothetical protein